MSRPVLVLLSLVLWVVVLAAVAVSWGFLSEFTSGLVGPENGPMVAGAGLGAVVLIGLAINIAAIVAFKESTLHIRDLSGEAKVRAAKQAAAKLIAVGDSKQAVLVLKEAGLLNEAADLAQEKGEWLLLGRLLMQMGNAERAWKHLSQAGDHFQAGHAAMLAKRPEEAREAYRRELEKAPPSKRLELARLMDRAGAWAQAAPVYEEVGDFESAADCYEMLGQPDLAEQCRERAKAVMAYGKRDEAARGGMTQHMLDARKANARQRAASHRDGGDYLLAGMMFREAEVWAEAAACFERMGHLHRAARDYRRAGQEQKAAELEARAAQQAPAQKPPASRALPPSAPLQNPPESPARPSPPAQPAASPRPAAAPAAASSSRVSPATVPVFLAPPAIPRPGDSAPARFAPAAFHNEATLPVVMPCLPQVASLVPNPAETRAWRAAADRLEKDGNLLLAADLNRRMGDLSHATVLLEQASRPRDAAMLAIAQGDYSRAAKLLVAELEKNPDPELGLLLGEMLIQLKLADLAFKLIVRHLAVKITEANAQMVYQFGRLFENAGEFDKAESLYQRLVLSGAESPVLQRRLRRVGEKRAARQRGEDVEETISTTKPPTPKPVSTLPKKERVNAWDFLEDVLEEEASLASMPPLPPAQVPPKTDHYAFHPRNLRASLGSPTQGNETLDEEAQAETALAEPRKAAAQVSLIGEPAPPAQRTVTAATNPPPPSTQVPDPFATKERYVLQKELGKGGMGTVHQAHDTVLDRLVALKLINSFNAGRESLNQFLLEARAIARLQHPNVITIYDVGLMGLRHYIAMEYVEGQDLGAYLRSTGPLPVKEALRHFIAIAEGLDAAHRAGVIHRDIKPGNMLLNREKSLKLVDFGLAKLQRSAEREGKDADPETIFRQAGTPGYMAPEQSRGEDLAPACDIYALGVTLFAMILGEPPHRKAGVGKDVGAILAFQERGRYPSILDYRPDVPAAIDQLYRNCVAPQVENRFQSVEAFLPAARQWHDAL